MSDERTPSANPQNLTPRQQLEASLAAGTITPELFATLSAQLTPDQPAAPPTPTKPVFSPSGNDEELPSLLDMFNQPPVVPASPASPMAPATPATQPAPASPSRSSAADAAARRLIEERLTQIRQRPAVEPAPPTPAPAPTPAPIFYPEPPAPTFYPSTPVVEVDSPPPTPRATPPRQAPPRASAPVAKPTSGGAGKWLLVVLLVLAVGGTLAYFFIKNSHPDESLTSPSLPSAEPAPTKATTPKPTKKTKKSPKKKRKNKKPAPVAAASETAPEEEHAADTTPVTEADPSASTAPTTTLRSPPAAPEPGDDAATVKIRTAMAAYYADLFTPPVHASQHFAPQVERLYIQQNLTPAAIDAELARSFFPENQQAIARIEPGTLRVSAPAADGSRTATFTETMRLYRVSLQKRQRLRTQVRVRFNADYKIVYMRQEKLLANTFEE